MEILSHSVKETQEIARDLAQTLKGGEKIGLVGSLGSAKTTFVQGMAMALGIDPQYYVNSPSYTLINEYNGRKRLIHMDLYRLDSYEALVHLGYEDLLGPDSVLVVEWADKFPEIRSLFDYRVLFEIADDASRRVSVQKTLTSIPCLDKWP